MERLKNLAVALAATTLVLGALAVGAEGAAPHWSVIGATGPTVLPPVQSEVQRLAVDAEGGSFTLTAHRTVVLARGTGNLSFFSNTITGVVTNTGAFAVGQEVEGGAIPAGATITEVGVGTLTISSELVFGEETGVAITAKEVVTDTSEPIPFDASASDLEGILNGLDAVSGAGGRVSITGGPGGPGGENLYTIVFGGTLEDTDVAQLVTDATGLTGAGRSATTLTVVPGGAGTTKLAVYGFNIGGYESEGPVTATVHLPAGVTTTGEPTEPIRFPPRGHWTCDAGAGASTFSCTNLFGVPPSLIEQPILVNITAAPGAGSGVITLDISGGGGKSGHAELPLTIGSTPAEPGIQSFVAGAYDSNGNSDTRAGAHPYSASTAIFANTIRTAAGEVVPAGEFKDISVELPPGFLGNPIAVPQCPESIVELECPFPTMVGKAVPLIQFGGGIGGSGGDSAVFNTEAPLGYPAKFRFNVLGLVPLNVVGSLRSESDFGITAASLNTPQIEPVYGTFFTFWGSPAEASHNASRCNEQVFGITCGPPAEGPPTAFLTNATNCAEQAVSAPVTTLQTTLWQQPLKTFTTKAAIPAVTGCDKLHFESEFTFQPSATEADSSASYKTSLTVPSEGLTNPSKLTTPELKKTVVKLPEGVTLNPSSANGLEACSEQQIGYLGGDFPMPNPMHFNQEPNTCPEASKIGTGELKTALLEEPLHGALYLAAQGQGNPFGSLFAIYLVIEDPRHGVFIKLPAEVQPDEGTGQMTVTFDNLPQLPFTRLDLNLKGGDNSALASPRTCGTYTTTTLNTPWSAPESGPPFETRDSYNVNSGPGGSACADTLSQRPFAPGLEAGSASPVAGAHSPFSIHITRPDGAQEVSSLDIVTPTGFSATLKGVASCTEAEIKTAEGHSGKQEQAEPACPAASQVGTTAVGAGTGANPFYASGKLYLSGPYKGAPLSIVAITPAVAGPLDLGDVVVRSALYVDPETAQITTKTDSLPEFLKGVQLRIRDLQIKLDRSDFTLNPTSCEGKSLSVTARGNSGATANLSSRFQVGGCANLKFAPKLKISLKGKTKRAGNPALTAVLTQPLGQANIARVSVALPHSEFLEQGHIRTNCTRVQFAAEQCPKGSIYGHAEAISPLLDQPLKGPVYLRSSSHKLPDLVAALKGPPSQPIEVDLDGRIDSIHGGIRTTFETVPDAPVSKFVLRMQGGKKSLLVNSTDICKGKHKAAVEMTGQNGARHNFSSLVEPKCGKKKSGKKSAKKSRGKKR